MCLAIPVRIMEIQEQMARVELDGVERLVSLALTPEAQLGDYVLIHTGYAISVLDEAEAMETLQLFDELEQASREVEEEERSRQEEDTARVEDAKTGLGGPTP
ncbi:MAG: HypC/HybG/HupF family hydrogenase formation chaperone [Chloroflexi bacterium]|nr:HypC/HybG/HupF family hydrogenase formation chaperone [Chloroflexota bacterium]